MGLARALTGAVLFFTLATAARSQQPVAATLVEVHASPKCSGLDCPPWVVPSDLDVCFEAEGKFFTGVYLPWGIPGDTKGERLRALRDKVVMITVTSKQIQVTTAGFKLKLKRVHHDLLFSNPSCTNS